LSNDPQIRPDPEEDRSLRAIVADDDPLARRMIKEALQRSGIVVIAEAHDGRESVELALHFRPDVVLMDIVMPELDGITATRRIIKEAPQQLVVVLTSGDDDDIGLLALRSGAVGFLSKDVDVDVLPQVVRGVIEGEAGISRRLGMRLVENVRQLSAGMSGMRPVKSTLTPREWEVLDLLADGMTTDQVAQQLVLSIETVRSHIKNIMRKLGTGSRFEAIRAARRLRGDLPMGDALPRAQEGRVK
jgi:DNA-binding NarL/FixJ family response regulator